MEWSVVYEKAVRDDGTLLFPERLSHEVLKEARRSMGSYLFANQYQNEIIPDDERKFKKEWLRYYQELPTGPYRFMFIDPAIGQKKTSDYTGVAIVEVDSDRRWFARYLGRHRWTPTEIVENIFKLHASMKFQSIGVESVAYQEALIHLITEKMKTTGKPVPLASVKRSNVTKDSRILSLVPRFEWGLILINQGMTDFEDEYTSWPRSSHDDILDALASIEDIVFYPEKKEAVVAKPHSPADPNYEKWYISQIGKQRKGLQDE